MVDAIRAPFPYFGGKSKVADEVWRRFGDCPNYVEPFFGSGAILLSRPHNPKIETVNDADGLLSNFWRAVQSDPGEVARWANWPVSECDLHARHLWLVGKRESITSRLMADPEWCDPKAAGWWVWGICQWIGSGWCSGEGPWAAVDGELVKTGGGVKRKLPHLGSAGMGINRKRPHLGNAGRGINRQLPHLGDAGMGINQQLPHLGDAGMGINRQLPHLGDAGRGINRQLPHLLHQGQWVHGATKRDHLLEIMQQLSDRLRNVRICCGDWSRVCGPTPTTKNGLTAIFLDPPYSDEASRDMTIYANDSGTVAHDVRMWALERGDDPEMRIALCGYDTEHAIPDTWDAFTWKARGGYGSQGEGRGRDNAARETIWFSPHCLKHNHGGHVSLFEED